MQTSNKYAGLKIIGFRADETACGILRVQYPLDYLAANGAMTKVVTRVSYPELRDYDYVLAQRQYSPIVIDMLMAAKDAGKTIIFEVDDDLHAVHNDSPAYAVYRNGKEELKNATRLIQSCHGLTVSTPELAAGYLKYNRNTYVIPNCVDFDIRDWSTPVNSRDTDLTVIWSGGTCYDDQTELLTENGFKLFKDLLPDEKVATLNPETWELEYQLPTEYINTPYTGDMLQAKTPHIDYCVTPNHWMYVSKTRYMYPGPENFSSIQASEIYGTEFFCKKDANIWLGENKELFELPEVGSIPSKQIPMNEWLKLFGFWLADGYTSHTSSITNNKLYPLRHVGFLQFKTPNDMQELKDILVRNNFTITERSSGEFIVCDKQLWSYLNQFGKASEKFIPKDILSLSASHLRLLLEWYIKGDGHKEYTGKSTMRMRSYTCSKKLVDNLTEIALKLGYAANYSNRGKRNGNIDGRVINCNHDQYTVSYIGLNTSKRFIYPKVRSQDQTTIHYSGNIHCIIVPNHTLYVRRNGKSFWCKNTHQKDLPILGRIVKALLTKYTHIKFAICTNPAMAKEAVNSWNLGTLEDRVIYIPDRDIVSYPQIWSHGDIGLAPIENTQFNRAKCIDKSTRVVTDYGNICIDSLNVNDNIWVNNSDNTNGHFERVVAKEYQPIQQGIKITTESGYTLDMTIDHRTPVNDGVITKASDLKIGDTVEICRTIFPNTEYITVPYPIWQTRQNKNYIEFDTKDCTSLPKITIDEIWGRLLGYFVGDGSCSTTQVKFTIDNKDQDVIEDILYCLKCIGLSGNVKIKQTYAKESLGCSEIYAASSRLLDFLATLGVAAARSNCGWVRKRTPIVPDAIWKSPKAVIANFIKAYFESDGTVSPGGHLSATSKDKVLLQGIQQLLLGFGIISKLTCRQGTKQYAGKTYYKLSLARYAREIFNKEVGFIGNRKNTIMRNALDKKRSNRSLPMSFTEKIISITPIKLEPVDIQVTGEELFSANGILTHNSPLKLEEMGAWGIPYVASKVAPYQRYIDQGLDGWTCENERISDWVEKVGILIENETIRKEMGEYAKAKVYEKFDYAKNLDNWVNAWRDIKLASIYGNVGPGPEVVTTIGRNDTCPCGSGSKYKRCCFPAWG